MGEIALQSEFLLAVPRELPHVRVFRRNVGAARSWSGNVVHFGIAGQCDLYALAKGGLHVEIELKALRGRLSPEQQAWADWCRAWAIPHLVLKAGKVETSTQTIGRWCEELRRCLTRG